MSEPAASSRPSRFRAWKRRVTRGLLQSRFVNELGGMLAYRYMRLVHRTNPLAEGSVDRVTFLDGNLPVIIALWHGQHIFLPLLRPDHVPMAALLSRNADAEMNAVLLRKAGFDIVRGSGGRDERQQVERGGAKALIQLKRMLDAGMTVNMIADISKSTPRKAGLGIVTLAKISGRPILPVAWTTSRRKVIEKSWDKTTISLPFGRAGLAVGDWITVDRDADEAALAEAARRLTAELDDATLRAYRLADGHSA